MDIRFHYISKKGKKTTVNEDTIATPTFHYDQPDKMEKLNQNGYFFIICDGVGGHKAGNIASYYCATWFLYDFYEMQNIEKPQVWLMNKIININDRIFALSKENNEYSGMGTTLVSLLLKKHTAYLHNVGDSRAYLFQNNTITQITEDHSVVWEDYKQKKITKEDILHSNVKHIITEAIGLKKQPKVNEYCLELSGEFAFLLCSDGLTDFVQDSELEDIFRATRSFEERVLNIYDLSQKKFSNDDVSIIIVQNY
jgi:protein phosphatase